jgi:hypothetical protein
LMGCSGDRSLRLPDLKNSNLLCFQIHSTSKNRTVVGFQIESYAGPRHLKTGPFDNRTYLSGFWMVSLDCFIKKRVIKNILFMPKRSRLEVKKKLWSGFQMVKTRWLPKSCKDVQTGCKKVQWTSEKCPLMTNGTNFKWSKIVH